MNKRTYDIDLNKLVDKTFKFLRNNDAPKHLSKTKNEKYNVHLMLVLYVLFCLADRSYRRFRRLIESCPPTNLKLKQVPSVSTMNRAWRRISPSFLRELIQISGRGGRDIKDIPFLALALAKKVDGIWSDDKDFEAQNRVKIFKTRDLI